MNDWQPNTNYLEGAIVIFQDRRRRCTEEHKSGETFDGYYWKKNG